MTTKKRNKTRAYIAIFIIVVFLLSTLGMWILYLFDVPTETGQIDFEAFVWDGEDSQVEYYDLDTGVDSVPEIDMLPETELTPEIDIVD